MRIGFEMIETRKEETELSKRISNETASSLTEDEGEQRLEVIGALS